MKRLFIVTYPSETDLFENCSEVFTEKEFKIANALVKDMRLKEVHTEHGIENDLISKKGWRDKYYD